MNMPTILSSRRLFAKDAPLANSGDGRWLPARYEPLYTLRNRLRATWLVCTGRADAIVWDHRQAREALK